jgi:hypothetical protein
MSSLPAGSAFDSAVATGGLPGYFAQQVSDLLVVNH